MRETLGVGVCPWEEECVQVGCENYLALAEQECQRYIELLTKIHGTPPGNARFQISYNPHDFGTYLEVDIHFDSDSDVESEWAYRVEANTPAQWDN